MLNERVEQSQSQKPATNDQKQSEQTEINSTSFPPSDVKSASK